MKKRLSSWSGYHLSIGGRVTPISSVLSSMPLYFVSFYKVPKKVAHEFVNIQRDFLWAGKSGVKKLAGWVGEKVCLPKKDGGLAVKNFEPFNISLFSQWKWLCLVDDKPIRKDLISFRYGPLIKQFWGAFYYTKDCQEFSWNEASEPEPKTTTEQQASEHRDDEKLRRQEAETLRYHHRTKNT